CRGEGEEVYQPTFTYHGFRYVKVSGITAEQATKNLLTYLVYHTELNSRGDFECSDTVANTLQEMTRRSILSNFHHFPTDCPQREKNGWTADAALSCEAALINFDPERNYREWMRNIRKAQREDGALPGIVPTGGWGFQWGNGPAWDCVLVYLPYFTYIYRGETEMITESADSFMAYLRYLRTRCDEKGLLHIGLGDWCHVGGISPKAPLILTDSVMSMDIANKAAMMFDAVNLHENAAFARGEAEKYRDAIRAELIDFESMLATGSCQSSQAMCLYYGVFNESEEGTAFQRLLEMIREHDDHIDVGVLGGRVIFHVLSRFGYSDLAFKMITREDYPSYGNWIKRGATTLWEDFRPNGVSSMNHHFWGDISAWFVKCVAGIRVNPNGGNVKEIKIAPSFVDALEHASASYTAPYGKISVSWKREGKTVGLCVDIPDSAVAFAALPDGFSFEDGMREKAIVSGEYRITSTL
ncbi:MAG: family 78 glycoside hydrolase catalytic domain, partial [Clostridia bacterium]|nr:family 78 glycoside hydrolase catalytic domain [Clostridia bacterium]